MKRMGSIALVSMMGLAGVGGCKKGGGEAASGSSGSGVGGGSGGSGGSGGAAEPAGCPALALTIDGAPSKPMHGFAVSLKNGQYLTEQVELFDSDAITCANVLNNGFQTPEGVIQVRVYYHPQAQGLGTDAYTDMGGGAGITLIAKAAKEGEPTTICVPKTAFTPNAGTLSGKKVEVAGAFVGRYCGVLDLTPK
ncbi:MAG: hypothetical protein K8W52_40390 [Deltaproteobacteria bacterium]|nr:hypothetical protein [Deltaproteobacteria bacterium]